MGELRTYEGCTAVVTGASKGIGAEFSRQLAAAGARAIVLASRDETLLESLAAELRLEHECDAHVVPLDLTEREAAKRLHERTRELGLQIDVLVNNAGFGRWGRFEERPWEDLQGMIDLNVTALVELTYLYGQDMLETGGGGILNIGSLASFFTIPYVDVYAATKAFVLSFSEGLWAEWKDRGVKVTCLCPGATETEFHRTSGSYLDDRGFMPPEVVARSELAGLLAGKLTTFASFKDRLQSKVPSVLTRKRTALFLKKKLTPPEE